MTVLRPLTIYLMPWGRVGSNLVNQIMSQGKGVKVYNEPLTRIDTVSRKSDLSLEETWVCQAEWLEKHIINATHKGPIFLNLAAVHIVDPVAFKTLMAPCDPVYVVHDRIDVAATVISAMRTSAWVEEGAQKGVKRSWAIPKGESVNFRPNIPAKNFSKMVGVVDKGRSVIKTVTAGYNTTTYYYEDLFEDMDGVITDIFAKARIPYHSYEVKSAKFGSAFLANMVSNAEELSDVIVKDKIQTELVLAR